MSQGGPGPQALYQAIREWTLHSEAPVTAQAQTLASQPQVDIALASQSRIRWLNVFRGFLSLDWGYFYSRDDQTPEDIRRSNATKILSKVVLAVHNYSVSIWKSRNAVLHEAENSIGSNIINSNLNKSITQLYKISETLSPILQSYFTIPLADRLTTTVRQRKRWLRLAQLASSPSTTTATSQQVLPIYFPHVTRPHASAPASVVAMRLI